MDLLPVAGVIIVYLLNLFFKKSSGKTDRPNEKSPYEESESFEEIRREILRKKKEREGLEEAEVELAMEADKARESEVGRMTSEVNEPSQFQRHIEEQYQSIKEKQEEAERLKIHLEQMNNGCLKKAIDSHSSNNRAIFARGKVRALLAQKSDIKAVLIAGEILAQPLALRSK